MEEDKERLEYIGDTRCVGGEREKRRKVKEWLVERARWGGDKSQVTGQNKNRSPIKAITQHLKCANLACPFAQVIENFAFPQSLRALLSPPTVLSPPPPLLSLPLLSSPLSPPLIKNSLPNRLHILGLQFLLGQGSQKQDIVQNSSPCQMVRT